MLKTTIRAAVLAAMICLGAGSVCGVYLAATARGSRAASSITAARSASAAACYTMRAWQGKVAVFYNDESKPEQVLNIFVATLPKSEQQRLASGVRVSTRQELLEMMEDYTS